MSTREQRLTEVVQHMAHEMKILKQGLISMGWRPPLEDTEYRYIRDHVDGNSKNSWNTWVEVQVIERGTGTNVALNKTVTASAGGTDLHKIVNGNLDINDYGYIAQGKHYITIDL